MASKFKLLLNHLSTPSFGLVVILVILDNIAGDYIFECPCDCGRACRICYALIYLICPVAFCFIMDATVLTCLWYNVRGGCHAIHRPLFLGILWMFLYASSSRFSDCFVKDLSCDCSESKSEACVEKKNFESLVQIVLAGTVGSLTGVTAVVLMIYCCCCKGQCCKNTGCCWYKGQCCRKTGRCRCEVTCCREKGCCWYKGKCCRKTGLSDTFTEKVGFETLLKLDECRLLSNDDSSPRLYKLSDEDVRSLDIPIGYQLLIIDEIKNPTAPTTQETSQ